jgi:exodeoxyribonuclease V alpha subunit
MGVSQDERTREEAPAQVLQGRVERVTFHSDESLYSVITIDPEKGYDDPGRGFLFRSQRLVAVGPMERPAAGLRLRLHGRWSDDPRHGRQFEFDSAEVLLPSDAEGVARYLAGSFEGIGETLAKRIVQRLGPQALEVIRSEPARLQEVPGLKPRIREALAESVRREFALHQLQTFLRGVGLGPRQAAAVVRHFGPACEPLLRADPYRMAGAVPGIGFATADRIARKLGISGDAPERCRAALVHALRTAAAEGHSLLFEPRLLDAARTLLTSPVAPVAPVAPVSPVSIAAMRASLADCEREGELRIDRELQDEQGAPAVYLPWILASEEGLAKSLSRLLAAQEVRPLADRARLESLEEASGLRLDSAQQHAVLEVLRRPLSLLTGGPGVGKTTIVRWIVALAEGAGARVRLASPTGRAAKRLSEATGRPASTIHRLLGYASDGGGFEHGERKPLRADLIVVDEISMLDVALAHHLFKAIRPPTRVLLVGDADQLPSVAAGNVLHDLASSGVVPLFRLSHVYRQGAGSLIVANAHRILAGELPLLPPRGTTSADFFLFPAEDPATCAERVVDVVTRRIPSTFGLSWADDVQVLAPMYRGECGVDALNERLRAALAAETGSGSAGGELLAAGRSWREGDRVMHTRNDYERELFNGDMGRVARVQENGLVVAFPEQEVFYTLAELNDLQPAFAVTVHRAQGSEYPAVVLPLIPQHFMMLQRNLLYTAVTRARRLLVLVGSQRALRMAVDNAEQAARLSGLARRLARVQPEPG